MKDEVEKKTVGKALGRIPSGVFILTVGRGEVAMMVSWVQQVGFEPPAVMVAVGKGRPALGVIKERKRFGLSVVGEGDMGLMKKYARGVKEGEDPFAGVGTVETPGGVTVLADALAWLECEVVGGCEYGGDHEVVVAKVVGGRLVKEGASFMHLRGNGFHY